MQEGSILRIDRVLSFALVSGAAALLALFDGGTSAYFYMAASVAMALAALVSESGLLRDGAGQSARFPAFSLPLVLFAAVSASSFLWSSDKAATLDSIPLALLFACSFWAVSRMVPKGRQATVFTVFFTSAVALAYSLFSWAAAGKQGPSAPSFPYLDNEGFAVAALAVAAFAMGFIADILLEDRGRSQEAARAVQKALVIISALAALVSVSSVFLSRSAFTAVLLVILALLVPTAARPGRRAKALAITSSCLLAGAIAAILISFIRIGDGAGALEGLALNGFAGRLADELYMRAQHWIMALKLGARSPFGGFGLGTFKEAMPTVYRPGALPATGDAHSFLLGMFAETGLAGALPLVIFMASAVLASLKGDAGQGPPVIALFAPVAALTMAMFTSPVPPAVLAVFFLLAGRASGDSVAGKSEGLRMHRLLPAASILMIALLAVATSVWGISFIPAKQEALHHAGHAGAEGSDETLEESLEDLLALSRRNPYDKELLFEITDTKARMAAASDPRDYSDALESADLMIARHPLYADAYALRGSIKMAQGGRWQDDYEKAASLSAGSVTPHLMLINYGLKEDLNLAVAYADKALEEEVQLFYRAGSADLEGVLALANLVELEAKAYVAYSLAGDEAKAASRAERLVRLYGMNEAVEGHVHGILEKYGMEDPVHGL